MLKHNSSAARQSLDRLPIECSRDNARAIEGTASGQPIFVKPGRDEEWLLLLPLPQLLIVVMASPLAIFAVANNFLAKSTNPISARTSKVALPTTSILGQVAMVR